MSNGLTAIVDADMIKYAAAFVGQKTSIVVTHNSTKEQWLFKNRTEFYGRKKSKDGEFLGKLNEGRDSPYAYTEFDIQDISVPEPIENVLHTTKSMYAGSFAPTGATKHKGFIGKGDSFRVERSTLLKYKDRDASLRPVYLEEISDYLEKRLGCEVITGIETDDRVVIECYKQPDKFIVGEDKDYYGQPVRFFNVNKPQEGIVNGDCFGKLWLEEKVDSKGKIQSSVRGIGRMFLYFQTMSQDDIDNYKANCFSDTAWAGKSAYNLLQDATDDKEAFEKMKKGFQILYPEPKIVQGWKGEVDIDWLYVMQECFTMARMLRTYDEPEVQVKDIFNKLGIQL